MKLKILFLLTFLFFNHFIFSQKKLDSLSLEERIEQYEYQAIDNLDLLTPNDVKEIKQEPKEEQIFKVVEDFPYFHTCQPDGLSKKELQECSKKEMLKFIYSNLKYPEQAKKNKTEGSVVVQFVVDKDSSIKNIKILKDIGNGCGEETVRIIELMNTRPPKWIPPYKGSRGKPIKVKLHVSIIFDLDKF